MPAQIVSVQLFGYYYTAYGRYPWDFKWGGPPIHSLTVTSRT
jgi:hypothetical protein